ncbi:MAG TPA: nucleotide exchange factor GrpE, partial [Solirubrobacterales bacterium]|nr:nucleotide exchange factor GrpE [Solirubrobacterales bacterium]
SSEALARGKAALARELIPVIDNLERALEAASAPNAEVSAQEALARGVALVHEDLRGRLRDAGVEAYDPIGERFDPALHEALSTRSGEGSEAGVVVETVEKGYRLNGQVLRPARVVVSE